MVCLGFVILEGAINLNSDHLHGSGQRVSLSVLRSTPPAPDGESHGVFNELCWFATSSPPHGLLFIYGYNLGC